MLWLVSVDFGATVIRVDRPQEHSLDTLARYRCLL